MVAVVDLGTGTTPAVAASRAIELLVSFFGLAMLLLSRVFIGTRRSARRRRLDEAPDPILPWWRVVD
jgi:apolipoprotein N-acyltransferase